MSDLYTRGLYLGVLLLGILFAGGVALLVGLVIQKKRSKEDHFDVGVNTDSAVQIKVPGRKKRTRKGKKQEIAAQSLAEQGLAGEQDVIVDDPGTPFGVISEVGDDPGLGMPLAVSELDAGNIPMPISFEDHFDLDPEPQPHPVSTLNLDPAPEAPVEHPFPVSHKEDTDSMFEEVEVVQPSEHPKEQHARSTILPVNMPQITVQGQESHPEEET